MKGPASPSEALPSLDDAERLARARLARTTGVGPVTFRDLLERFGSGRRALDALPELAARGGRKGLKIAREADIAREEARHAKFGARMLVLGEDAYPPLLAETDPPPPILIVKGQLELLTLPTVAIVGSRTASAAGARLAGDIAAGLGRAGLTIASGLARGVDAAAHRASLETGTIAAIASGIDIAYPPENERLQAEIAERGLLMTEQAPGQAPHAKQFPRRNRLISGLSLAVVVVEAALRSGSLITARFALEQGRDVMAVPASPLDPRGRGCNRLIKQGALLVEEASDILEALGPGFEPTRAMREAGFAWSAGPIEPESPGSLETEEAARRAVIEALSPTPTDIDVLARHTGLDARTVRAVLLELDLAGRIARDGARRVSLYASGPDDT